MTPRCEYPGCQDTASAVDEPPGAQDPRYLAYLASPVWATQREVAFERWGRFCNACGTASDLTVHHLFYRDLNDCLPADLMPLCQTCHDTFHAVGVPPYPLGAEEDHFKKRAQTIRRILRYRFGAPAEAPTIETKRQRWRASKELRRRPEWRDVDFDKITTAILLAALKDPNFEVRPEWALRGRRI